MKPINLQSPQRIEWELDVFHAMSCATGIPRTDVEGIAMLHEDFLDEAFAQSMSPADAAAELDRRSTVNPG